MATHSITSNTNAAPTSFSFSSTIKAGSSMQSNFTGHDLDMRLNRERSSDTSEKIAETQCVPFSAQDGGAVHSVLNAQKVGKENLSPVFRIVGYMNIKIFHCFVTAVYDFLVL